MSAELPGPNDPYAVPDPIAGAALTRPGHPALELGEESLTWAEYDRRVGELAGALRESGVVVGDRVAVGGARSLERVVAQAAVERAGAVLCPLPARGSAAGGEELGRTLAALAPRWLLNGPGARCDEAMSSAPEGLQELDPAAREDPDAKTEDG